MAPGIVAIAGRMAATISASGFAEVSSERQKASSSSNAAARVRPRTVRNDAVATSITTRRLSSISSVDCRSINGFSIGTFSSSPAA